MVFLDNGSTDRTLAILKSLKDEGFPLSVFQGYSVNFDEVTVNTRFIIALTGPLDARASTDRRNFFIAQRWAKNIHSSGGCDRGEFSPIRKGQVLLNDALKECLELSGRHDHLEPDRIVAICAPGMRHALGQQDQIT